MAILDASERHFLNHGFQDAKVDEIADSADVAVGSIYNHFAGKDGLYLALLDRAIELHERYMTEWVSPNQPPLDQLVAIAHARATFAQDHPGLVRMLTLPDSVGDGPARVAGLNADHERRLVQLIQDAIDRGDSRPVDPEHTASFLWGAWNGLLTKRSHVEQPAGAADLRAALDAGLELVLAGLARDGSHRTPSAASPAQPPTGAPARAPTSLELQAEHPDLALWVAAAQLPQWRTPVALKRRLAELSERFTGTVALKLHDAPVAQAYRSFFRQIGLDPYEHRAPVETIARQRMLEGSFPTRNTVHDVLLIAVIQTGVPVIAISADQVRGPLGLRFARAGEPLGEAGKPLSARQIVIADSHEPIAVLFDEVAPPYAPDKDGRELVLASIQVKGVPDSVAREALFTATEILRALTD